MSGQCFLFYDSCLLNEEVINSISSLPSKQYCAWYLAVPVRETSTGLRVFRGKCWEVAITLAPQSIRGDGGAATVHTAQLPGA